MAEEYDKLAIAYTGSRTNPSNMYTYDHSVLRAVGNLEGKDVLDIGCGDGGLSRKIIELGASSVVGFDISSVQIGLALLAERTSPTGAQFMVGNACDIELDRQLDVAVASHVFHYAQTKEQLGQMFENAYSHLRPGGKLVALLSYFESGRRRDKKYGYTTHRPWFSTGSDGNIYRVKLYNEVGWQICSFWNNHWRRSTYEYLARRAGFDVEWRVPGPSAEGIEKHGFEFWRDYIDNPNHQILVATKPLEVEESE